MSRREELAEWALALRAAGWTARRIAAELEVSRSYAAQLYLDPTGEKNREKKKRYAGVCEDCGGPTYGGAGRERAPKQCADCAKVNPKQRVWTRDSIVAAFREFHAVTGRTPAASDFIGRWPSGRGHLSAERLAEIDAARHLHLPNPTSVRDVYGSWRAAVEAAGLTPAATGGQGHRKVEARYTPRGVPLLPIKGRA